MPLFDWQADTLRRAMAWDGHRLERTEIGLIVPRRNGKTQLLMARILGGCLGTGKDRGEDVLYTAHLGDTARAMFKAFLDLLGESPLLSGLVQDVYHGKGDEAVVFKNGSRFTIRARTNSGGRGLESDTLILDEALEVNDDHMSALRPLVAKAHARGSGQIWLASSAGHGRSTVLAALRDRGRAAAEGSNEPDLFYAEWLADRGSDPADPTTWYRANPSLGSLILHEQFLRMQQRSMSREGFGREHLGWWTDEIAETFLPAGTWEQCTGARPQPEPFARIVFGFEWQDYGHAVLVAGVSTGAGRAWVEPIARWHDPLGLDPERLANDILSRFTDVGAHTVAADEFTCTTVLDHLAARGVPVERMNQPAIRSASQLLFAAVTSGRVTHPADPITDLEVRSAGKATTGDGLVRLSRRNSTGRSAGAFAVAAALRELLEPRPDTPRIH